MIVSRKVNHSQHDKSDIFIYAPYCSIYAFMNVSLNLPLFLPFCFVISYIFLTKTKLLISFFSKNTLSTTAFFHSSIFY